MSDGEEHYRLVVMGSGKVGKTAIIQQFINNKFEEKYKETVEDLHCREYHINGHSIKVDILDTSGTLQFPAMRRLSISTAHAFVLVYSIDDSASFENVKQIYNQIQEQRTNFGDIPIVVVGNKSDLELQRRVDIDDARVTLAQNNWHCAHVEASAKENSLILDIFQKLLQMAKIPIARELSPVLKRRMSEYGYKSRQRGERRSFRESDKEMSRSRSLIRRSARPKMKATDPNKNDCVIC
ncbi:dexamethasone-induced Ras-related protein 1-like [Lytechinus pictus]|uniref:dexamethasone-induced Ras-related protein 1-like n=1 Tax=Lytechinus variegatus TaxID=7654 RepID=UPI001BB1C5AB|nr:dexamethasone-induced Ras-related protein 1-like [Lytechinus variegatus]XP_054763436.1 dexamethasone-induced Ras-related protein 1-like [Lytechinus pictus]